MNRYAIYGSSGFAREVMPLVRIQADRGGEPSECVFVDDDELRQGTQINGLNCISFAQLKDGDRSSTRVCIAVSDWQLRRKLAEKCEAAGLLFFNVEALSHSRYDDVRVREGGIFCAHTMITSNVEIGRQFQCNIYSYVAHDCVIGDFVTFAPRVSCNGNTVIEDGAYIGTGAVLKQGTPDRPLRIGKGAVVGMGAVVTRDVAPGSTVVGNPARPIQSRAAK